MYHASFVEYVKKLLASVIQAYSFEWIIYMHMPLSSPLFSSPLLSLSSPPSLSLSLRDNTCHEANNLRLLKRKIDATRKRDRLASPPSSRLAQRRKRIPKEYKHIMRYIHDRSRGRIEREKREFRRSTYLDPLDYHIRSESRAMKLSRILKTEWNGARRCQPRVPADEDLMKFINPLTQSPPGNHANPEHFHWRKARCLTALKCDSTFFEDLHTKTRGQKSFFIMPDFTLMLPPPLLRVNYPSVI